MKNNLFIFIAFATIFFSACGTRKIVKTNDNNKIEVVKILRDSVVITRVSEPIKDTVFISLQTNNRVIDSVVNERLKNLKTVKRSGTNSVKIVYDTIYKTVKIITSVEGTKDKETQTNLKSNLKFEEKKVENKETTKTKYPVWLYVAIVLVLVVLGLKIVKIML